MASRRFEAEVLVIGGGTAGFGAAIAAARQGCEVTLLEASRKIGGVMAVCPGMPWGGAYPAGTRIGGIFGELAARLEAMAPPAAETRPCALENFGPEIVYDPDIATLTMFEMLDEAGVTLRLGAAAFGVGMEGARVVRVDGYDRGGAFSAVPRIVIDCSGDGVVSAAAGVPHRTGDGAGNMMGVTVTFHMVGVDCDAAFAEGDPYFTRQARKGVAEGRLHPDLAKLYLMRGFHPGTVFCNSVHIRGVDGTDPGAIARATQEGCRRCHQLARFLRADVPGFSTAHMALLSPSVGVRETRSFEAVYEVTGPDLAAATAFDDGIVCCDNPIDDVMRGEGEMTHDAIVESGRYYTIPFRSLLPRAVTNLMFAGRTICADPVAFASVRGMPQCMAMGQATGAAAALALRDGVSVQAVELVELVDVLTRQGVKGLGGRPLQ